MLDAILTPAENGVVFTLATVTASSTKSVPSRIFVISTDQTVTITFTKDGTPDSPGTPTTPSSTVGLMLPAGVVATFDTGQVITGMKFFNTSGTTANIGIAPMSGF